MGVGGCEGVSCLGPHANKECCYALDATHGEVRVSRHVNAPVILSHWRPRARLSYFLCFAPPRSPKKWGLEPLTRSLCASPTHTWARAHNANAAATPCKISSHRQWQILFSNMWHSKKNCCCLMAQRGWKTLSLPGRLTPCEFTFLGHGILQWKHTNLHEFYLYFA